MDRRKLSLSWVALSGVAVAGLAGCAEEGTNVVPTGSTSAPPSTELSDEQRTALAREAYEGYLSAGEAMSASSTFDPTDLEEWATPEMARIDATRLDEIRASGLEIEGRPGVLTFDFVSLSDENLTVLVCLDLTSQRYTNQVGDDVTPIDQPATAALRLMFAGDPPEAPYLLAGQSGAASDHPSCFA